MIKVRTSKKSKEKEEKKEKTGFIVYCEFVEKIAKAIIRISDVLRKEISNGNAIRC